MEALLLAALATAVAPAGPMAVSPDYAVRKARDDARTLPPDEAAHVLYFWVDLTEEEIKTFFAPAFRLGLNLSSREPEMAGWVEVCPWLWRVDLEKLGIDRSIIENAAAIDPIFHAKETLTKDTRIQQLWPGGVDRKGKFFAKGNYGINKRAGQTIDVSTPWLDDTSAILELRELLHSEVPILSAQWFLGQTARQTSLRGKQTGLGYYDILKIKDRNDYFKLVGLDEKAAIDRKKEVRAALDRSEVSDGNRQIVRLSAQDHGVWGTLDTDDQSKAGIAIKNLRRGEFRHQAEEYYGPLSNGLMAFFLCDNNGVRQNEAPQFIGDDTSQIRLTQPEKVRDGKIHINIACIRCHAGNVLQPIDDFVRNNYPKGGKVVLGSPKRAVKIELERQYLGNLDKWLERDRRDFKEAIREATITKWTPKGLTAQQAAEAYARAYHRYADDLIDLKRAARELGTTPEHLTASLLKVLKETGEVDTALSTFVAPRPGSLSRLTWEASYSAAQDYVRGLIPKAR